MGGGERRGGERERRGDFYKELAHVIASPQSAGRARRPETQERRCSSLSGEAVCYKARRVDVTEEVRRGSVHCRILSC